MKAWLSFLFILCFYSAFAQVLPTSAAAAPKLGPPVYLRDLFSSHIDPKPYANIKGSPFVEDRWTLARIKAEGRKELIDSIPIKLNVYTNGVHFINELGQEMQIDLRIEQITIIDDSSDLKNTVFLSNFYQEKGFFKVIEDGGKLKLLKKLRIFIWEVQQLGAELQRSFEVQDDLYISFGETLYKPTKSCTAIRNAFGNNDKVFDYIAANKLSCSKETDIRKIVAFYAGLK